MDAVSELDKDFYKSLNETVQEKLSELTLGGLEAFPTAEKLASNLISSGINFVVAGNDASRIINTFAPRLAASGKV